MNDNVDLVFGVGSDSNDLEKGIYACSLGSLDRKVELWKRLGLDEVVVNARGGQTPREIKFRGNEVYAATRDGLFIVNRKGEIIQKKGLIDFFKNEDKLNTDLFVNQPTTHVGMLFTPSTGWFVSVSAPSEDKESQEVYVGSLLHSPNGNLDGLEPIRDIFVPTSTPIYYNHGEVEKIWVPCFNRLETILLNTLNRGRSFPSKEGQQLKGKILSVSTANGVTVCTDDKDGYMIIDERNGSMKEKCYGVDDTSDFLLDEKREEYLPSEATSSLVTSIDGKMYVLMGLNDGLLDVYEVDQANNYPKLSRKNRIQFISDWKAVEESYKDNHIYGLKEHNGFLQFTLRNLYFRMRCASVVVPQQSIITSEEEKKEDYLSILEHKFDPVLKIYETLHRISCWDNYRG
jgi:hypothetical protein